jgi:hypothetical protein
MKMKLVSYIIIAFTGIFAMASCNKHEATEAGTHDLDHHYYAIFVPNNNSAVSVSRSQTALLKFPVQFYSTFVRDYDAVAKYAITTYSYTPPAVRGVDYNIVDRNGVTIPTTDTTYTITFPQAKQALDTIYIKLLNNTAPGARKFEVQILDNITTQFDVDIFSTAYRRPITIN